MNSAAARTSFGTLLRLHRRRLGLTQEALAERAGFSPAFIKKLEAGSRRPSVASVEVLAHILELDSDHLESFRAARIGAAADMPLPAAGGGESIPDAATAGDELSDTPALGVAGSAVPVAQTVSAAAHASPPAEERRLVTAMFSNIGVSSSLPENLDPEDLRDIQSTYVSAVEQQVKRYGGVIERCGGDSVLALFGVPLAHEDDPERAVLCALGLPGAMQQAVQEVGRSVDVHMEEPLVCVGIETGDVVIGPSGAWPWGDVGVSGDAVDTAVRLQTTAKSTEILVGQETVNLTRGRIRYGKRRKLHLKGRSAPVPMSAALGSTQRTDGLWQAVHETLPPARFVGRVRQIEDLNEFWNRAQTGEGQLVSIVGEPGVGKSRLIAEFVSHSPDVPGIRLIQGRCPSYGQAVSLWLIADMLRSLFGIGEDDATDAIRDRLEAILPELLISEDDETQLEARDVLGEVLGLPPSESSITRAAADIRREALARSLRRIMAAVSSRGPAILVLQDLHWIDASSAEVLGRVTVDTPGLRLLVLVAQRDGWIAPWSGLGWPERINLRPLPPRDAAVLAASVLGDVPLSAELEQYLAERAGGNPFFVEELARALQESGGMQQRDARLHLVPDVAQRLPTTLSEILQARLDRLEPPVKATAQLASVIGRDFAVRLLAEVAGEAQATLEAPLLALQQAEIASPRGYQSRGASSLELEYSFRHVTMREVAYNTLVRNRRRELHHKTAKAIAALYPSDEYVETIAYHYARADAGIEAAEWFERAGDRAASVYANDAAQTHYRNAIDTLGEFNDRESLTRVREKLGDVLLIQSRYDPALALYQEALEVVGSEDRILRARLLRKVGDVWGGQRSFLQEALAAWDAAEEALGAKPRNAYVAYWNEWLEIQIGRMRQLYFADRIDELEGVAERTRPVVEMWATPIQCGRFFEELCVMTLRRDGYLPTEATIGAGRVAVEALEGVGDAGSMGDALFVLGFALLWYGATGEAEETMLRSLDLAERSGRVPTQSMCTTYLTLLYRRRGDVDRTRLWNGRSLAVAVDAKRTEYVAMAAANRAWLAWKDDNLSTAEAEARSAVAAWRRLSSAYPYMFWWAGLWILIDISVGQHRLADAIEEARMLFGPEQARVPVALASVLHGAIEAWEGADEDTAHEHLQEAIRLAKEMAYI